jgi:hypothetical protein
MTTGRVLIALLVEEQLRAVLCKKQRWALVRANLRGFKPFSAAYGFLAGEETDPSGVSRMQPEPVFA